MNGLSSARRWSDAETTEPAARMHPTCASESPRPPYLAMRKRGSASSIRTTQNEKKA